jgi:hypothetical protein
MTKNFRTTPLDILKASEIYAADLPSSLSELAAELALWNAKWQHTDTIHTKPCTAITALAEYDNFVPNIRTLLQLMATLPFATATAERSFSTLRRLKNYLRSTMGEERLNGLAFFCIPTFGFYHEQSVNLM